MSAFIIMT